MRSCRTESLNLITADIMVTDVAFLFEDIYS